MAIKIKIGSMVFDTKTKAINYYKDIFHRYSDRQNIEGKDYNDLLTLVKKHPNSKDKIGSGIRRIYRDKTKHGASCFWIERTDGTKVDFSFLKCIDAAGITQNQPSLQPPPPPPPCQKR